MTHARILLVLLVSTILTACSKEADPELQNRWKLIATLMDPGDGSGQFVPVDSDKTIEFFEDGTFESNGPLCTMGVGSSTPTTGTYSEVDMTMAPEGCTNSPMALSFVIEDGHLILSIPCIEPCREKYEVVD